MDDIIYEFLEETNESLGELDNDLVLLEQDPNNDDLIGKIFRVLHTIKGTCGFLALPRLEKVAHKGEDVLGLFRDKKLEVTPEYVTLIFECFDRIKEIVQGLEQTGQEPQGDDTDIIKPLEEVYAMGSGGGAPAPAADAGAVEDDINAQIEAAVAAAEAEVAGSGSAEVDQNAEIEAAVAAAEAALVAEAGDNAPSDDDKNAEIEAAVEAALAAAEAAETAVEGVPVATQEELEDEAHDEPASEDVPVAAAEKETPPAEDKNAAAPAAPPPQTLRVNVEVLEDLMTMVSELVLTRNQLMQIARQQEESEFVTPLQRLNHVVSELQEGVMKTRMQPIGNAWAKLPRIIRDVSNELGKKIDLQMIGEDTELDRQVLDMIKDPLTHMIRNSADHGVEAPADRVAAGKPETGKIVLSAYHEGGHINIEISDDGKGLALDKIKQKVLDNGLATEEQLSQMTDKQIQQFIFHAGLSTADKISAVSGRGVGMDVVRSNIEKIGGSIELTSEEGRGTTFIIKIPLTLAIVSSLIVGVSDQRFALPQLTVAELVLVGGDTGNEIEMINDSPVLRLRENLLPLISLADLLGVEKAGSEDGLEYVVVTKVGSYMFGLVVDDVFDLEEIVIKPLSSNLKDVEIFAGNTILGDGRVIMILDPSGILSAAGVDDSTSHKDDEEEEEIAAQERGRESLLLLFHAGDGTLKAAPVDMVSRLEEVELDRIERTNGQPVIQYRGHLMPIQSLGQGDSEKAKRPLIIFRHDGKNTGLMVDRILDIKKYYGDLDFEGHSNIAASVIIEEQAADVVNAKFMASQGVFIDESEASHG